MALTNVDDTNFDLEVTNYSGIVLVLMSAAWCGPCARQLPIIEQFAAANIGKVKICKVDVDDAPITTAKMNIRGVPSIILFYQGRRLETKVGLTTVSALNNLLLEKVGA